MRLNWKLSLALVAALATPLLSFGAARAQSDGDPVVSIELVDPKVLRVCADPNNLPFSNEKGEGYENKLAEFLAKKLGKSLAYTFYPGATGFVRLTLMSHKCDIIMSFPQGDDLVQPTNPYFRTAYALIFKPGSGFEGIESLDDPHLQGKRFGIVARTPITMRYAIFGPDFSFTSGTTTIGGVERLAKLPAIGPHSTPISISPETKSLNMASVEESNRVSTTSG